MNLFTKQKQTHTHGGKKKKTQLPKGEGGKNKLEIWN